MTILRFIFYSVGWVFAPLLIIVLVIAWVVLALILAVWNTWLHAKRDPRYDPSLF